MPFNTSHQHHLDLIAVALRINQIDRRKKVRLPQSPLRPWYLPTYREIYRDYLRLGKF